MKIFTGAQIHELDKYTIEKEPVKSIDLMERAARTLTVAITRRWSSDTPIVVFAGPGNNGGDALAVARMMAERGYDVQVFLFNIHGHLSDDCAENKARLTAQKKVRNFVEIRQEFDPPVLDAGTLVIDGLFGTGLDNPLNGGFASLVRYINASESKVVSIDIPSGMMTEDNSLNIKANIIRADLTLTLQQKKLSFLFADTQKYLGELEVLDINLSREGMAEMDTDFTVIEESEVREHLLSRNRFAHKGNMGHALLLAGSYGMAGAAILATRACLRSGAGKVTVRTPQCNNEIMQIAIPEAIVSADESENIITSSMETDNYDAVGIGPGIGQDEDTAIAVIGQVRRADIPVVLDADALNVLAKHSAWLEQLPQGVIMTPHPKEMERLANLHNVEDYEILDNAREMAKRHGAYVVLKGHYTAVCMPDGRVSFNSTGNAGMATAGSGDVLTGIITSLLARRYKAEEACKIGVYLHGLAGDLAAEELGEESLVAGDIIRYLPKAFLRLKQE